MNISLFNRFFNILFIFCLFYPTHFSLLTSTEKTAITTLFSCLGVSSTVTSPTDPCTWVGVGCIFNTTSSYHNVYNITLTNLALTGHMCPANLPKLQRLDLRSNSLKNNVQVTSYPQLQYLQLSYNQFTGALPPFPSSMNQLRLIDI
eukprot:gene7666-8278_t